MADTWEELTGLAQQKLGRILKKDVAPAVKRILARNIDRLVYSAYTPSESESGYRRRGALGDTANMSDDVLDGWELFVTSVAPPAPSIFAEKFRAPLDPYDSRLLQWIEYGCVPNYFNNQSYPWMSPRPVVAATQAEMESGSEVSGAIEAGIGREFK